MLLRKMNRRNDLKPAACKGGWRLFAIPPQTGSSRFRVRQTTTRISRDNIKNRPVCFPPADRAVFGGELCPCAAVFLRCDEAFPLRERCRRSRRMGCKSWEGRLLQPVCAQHRSAPVPLPLRSGLRGQGGISISPLRPLRDPLTPLKRPGVNPWTPATAPDAANPPLPRLKPTVEAGLRLLRRGTGSKQRLHTSCIKCSAVNRAGAPLRAPAVYRRKAKHTKKSPAPKGREKG